MTTAAGLALALGSAFALNWGWLAQHSAASELPALTLRAPIRSLRSLFRNRTGSTGFLAGVGGWVLYVAALALAPLSLVQATSAGGIGLLAVLVHRRGDHLTRGQWLAVGLAVAGLLLLAVSLAGGAAGGRPPAPGALAGWLGALRAARTRRGGGAHSDRAGRGARDRGGPPLRGGRRRDEAGRVRRPLASARARPARRRTAAPSSRSSSGSSAPARSTTAGTASLLTNAVPIAAGVVLFHEHLPAGALGDLRVLAFVLVVVAAGLLARPEGEPRPVLPVPIS